MAIPFYGSTHPDLFAIERAAMDPAGLVIAALDRRLPTEGTVIDVGAGDGFTAARLATPTRRVIPVEPSAGMRDQRRETLPFVAAVAQALPFASSSVDAAISTWAYFFTTDGWDPRPGLDELRRVVRPGGAMLIVDNLGDDEFTAMAPADISADVARWEGFGFACEPIATEFAFTDGDDARRLFELYFGPGVEARKLSYTYRVGLFHAVNEGPATNSG